MNIDLIIAALVGALSVTMDAYTAHALTTLDQQAMDAVSTALQYHLINSVVLMVLALLTATWPSCQRRLRIVYSLFLTGTVLFCVGIYGAYLFDQQYLTTLTPFGGLLMIVAWFSLILVAVRPAR